MRFTDKRVVVSGAASGIGRSTALAFATEGAVVMAADINAEGLRETAFLKNEAGEIHTCIYDASSRSECLALIDAAAAQLGGIDVLCNIAGFTQPRHFVDYSEQDWQRMLAVNLSGVFYCCQAAIPYLLEGEGSIINMASSAGITGQAYQASYCATKGGVVMLTKSLAMEFASRNVRVNAICPGTVDTPLVAKFEMPENIELKLFERLFPLLDAAQPEEIAAAAMYLASDDARYVTGIALPVDGGQTAG